MILMEKESHVNRSGTKNRRSNISSNKWIPDYDFFFYTFNLIICTNNYLYRFRDLLQNRKFLTFYSSAYTFLSKNYTFMNTKDIIFSKTDGAFDLQVKYNDDIFRK